MIGMDSFALGYLSKKNSDKECKFKVKVNVNLWMQCGWKLKEPVLDLGFMLYNLRDVEKLYIYIPFELENTEFIDLCETVAKERNLLGAIFNEPYLPESCLMPKRTKIEYSSKKPHIKNTGDVPFYLYALDSQNDLNFEKFQGQKSESVGTFITINAESIVGDDSDPNVSNYYIRFRLKTPKLSGLVRQYHRPNRCLESFVNAINMAEFRFNNTRSMDHSLVEKLTDRDGVKLAPISSLHFLLMTHASVDVDCFPFKSSRVIEKNIWNDYVQAISDGKEPEDIVAYHAKFAGKDNDTIDSIEVFTKIKIAKSEKIAFVIYFLIGFLIASLYEVGLEYLIRCWYGQ